MPTNTTHQLQLFYWVGACSVAPHILLHELDLPFEAVRVDKSKRGLEQIAHLNPKLRIPVLIFDDEVITELPAIMTAIAQLNKSRHLLGKTDIDTVRIYEWMNWLSGSMHGQGWASILRPERFLDDESVHSLLQEKGTRFVEQSYVLIEEKLRGVYAVGDYLTIVDPFLYVFWRWGSSRGLVDRSRYPKYARLVDSIEHLPSTQRVFATEGISASL